LKIAFITPELHPLVQATGLAEFSHSLTRALAQTGREVHVCIPWHGDLEPGALENLAAAGSIAVRDGIGKVTFEIHSGTLGAVRVHLFAHEGLFGDRSPYGEGDGPYADNWRRYGLFSRAVLASFEPLGLEPEVIHCIDWTTGMLPVIRELAYSARHRDHPAARAGIYFQIYNLAIQGVFEREILPQMGLPQRIFTEVGGVELAGKVNFLKAGAEFATILGTHSPGHAARIQEQDRGYGLESVFRRRHKELIGIVNGIDYHAWDPSTDPLLAQPYSAKDKALVGKKKCKATLQAALSLEKAARAPLAAMIGRFDSDSGFDLVAEMLTSILERNVEVVLMGAGRPDIHERLKTMEATFLGRCRVIDGYQLNTAHAIMGGADMLLLPSHYSPGNALCAIGMRYGVVPIIYAASGLEDYVIDLEANPRSGTGFHFERYTGEGLLEGIDAARKLYKNPAAWKQVVSRCLRQDFSWQAAAQEYVKAYRRVTRRVRPREKSA
jgi:starch synthase